MRRSFVLSSVLLCASVAVSQASWAAPAGTFGTAQTDLSHMHATPRLAGRAGCEVHELPLASGTLVREFAAPSGTVFGVAWQGPFKPDLSQLLGAHFPPPGGRGPDPARRSKSAERS